MRERDCDISVILLEKTEGEGLRRRAENDETKKEGGWEGRERAHFGTKVGRSAGLAGSSSSESVSYSLEDPYSIGEDDGQPGRDGKA